MKHNRETPRPSPENSSEDTTPQPPPPPDAPQFLSNSDTQVGSNGSNKNTLGLPVWLKSFVTGGICVFVVMYFAYGRGKDEQGPNETPDSPTKDQSEQVENTTTVRKKATKETKKADEILRYSYLDTMGYGRNSANRDSTVKHKPWNRNPAIPPPRATPRDFVSRSARAQLNFRWVDATQGLLPIAQRLTPSERAAVGLTALATGIDIYGARVSLSNNGSIPIRIFPQNIRIQFNGEAAVVYTIDDYRFLRAMVLEPGKTTSGLVMYVARMDIGAAIRLGEGTMSYVDSTVVVTFK